MNAVGLKFFGLHRAGGNKRRNVSFLRNRYQVSRHSGIQVCIAAGAGSAHLRPARRQAQRSAPRASSRARSCRPPNQGIVWCRVARGCLRLHAPIEADCGGNKKGSHRKRFRTRESGFPCHRFVFSPDFHPASVYQTTGSDHGLPWSRGFGRFSANLRAHETVEAPASDACLSLFGANSE